MVILIYFNNLYQIIIFKKILTQKYKNNLIVIIFPILFSVIFFVLILSKVFISLVYLIMLIFYVVFFKFFFFQHASLLYLIYSKLILLTLLIKDTVVCLLSLLLKQNFYTILNNQKLSIVTVIFINLIIIIILFILDVFYINQKFKCFFNHKKYLTIFILDIVLIIYIFVFNILYYYKIQNFIFNLIINNIMMISIFFLIIMLQVSLYKINKFKDINKLLETKLIEQKKIYEKRDGYSKLLKIYNHDFKNILSDVIIFLEKGEIENAKKILLNTNLEINNTIKQNESYSNRLIVDIILNKLYQKCQKINISFSANCYIPDGFDIQDLDLSRIFNNLTNNAYEACLKQKELDKKNIRFKSYIKNNKLVIYEENTFNGEIIIENKKLTTTKKNRDIHGIGIKSICEIVNRLNGIYLIKIDNQKCIFRFLIKIPYNPN